MFKIIFLALTAALRSRRQLALENVALRHRLTVLQRNAKRPQLRPSDRAFWAVLTGILPDWRNQLSETAAIDFLTVPTITFKTLHVFVILSLDRRPGS